jgi:hypothetical protein
MTVRYNVGGWFDAVPAAEDFDSVCLLARVGAVGAQVEPEQDRVAEIVKPLSWCRCVEVDDRYRSLVTKDEVAGREVVVAHDFMGRCDLKTRRGIVVPTDQACGSNECSVRDRRVEIRRA